MPHHSTVEQQSITTIRTLAMDAVQAANSGHPGTPMALAPGGKPDVLLLASGSEVALCVTAHEQLKAEGIKARVISMPSWELFEQQSQTYKDSVIPPDVTARVAVEQASTFGWARFTGLRGARIGVQTFGASAPLKELQQKFGFTPEQVVAAAHEQVNG